NGYLGRRYQEFNKQKLPYDPKLEAKTKQEQKDVAIRNAATLQARAPVAADDLYYLGLLHHVAGDADAALAAMRLFLKDDPVGPIAIGKPLQRQHAQLDATRSRSQNGSTLRREIESDKNDVAGDRWRSVDRAGAGETGGPARQSRIA